MARFILRYRGKGAAPEPDVKAISARLEVVERLPRMLLVSGEERVVRDVTSRLPDWLATQESTISVPDTRERIRN